MSTISEPCASPDSFARIATAQDAILGGFEHADAEKLGTMKLDPEAAKRIHGKPEPRVHIETYG